MKQQEMNELSRIAAKKEFDEIIDALKKAAARGETWEVIGNITDATKEMMREAGYSLKRVENRRYLAVGARWVVSWGK